MTLNIRNYPAGAVPALAIAFFVSLFALPSAIAQSPAFVTVQTPIHFRLTSHKSNFGSIPLWVAGDPYVVDPAKRLTIEMISANCYIPNASVLVGLPAGRLDITLTTNGTAQVHHFYPGYQMSSVATGSRHFGFTQQTRLYADAGSFVSVATDPSPAALFHFEITFSGYSVPAGSKGTL